MGIPQPVHMASVSTESMRTVSLGTLLPGKPSYVCQGAGWILHLTVIHTHHPRQKPLNIYLLLYSHSHSVLGLLSHLLSYLQSLPGLFTNLASLFHKTNAPTCSIQLHNIPSTYSVDLFQENWFSFSLMKGSLHSSTLSTSVRMWTQTSDHCLAIFIL